MLIDTHAHLWFDDFKNDLEEVLARAKEVGVEKIVVPGTDIESCKQAVELAKKYPGVIYASVGVHPEEILEQSFKVRPSHSQRSDLGALIAENREWVVAIGEIGTDASTEELKKRMDQQKELFRAQCELALEFDLPVIIHTRNSLPEALEVLDTLPTMPRGQFHCFSHDEAGLKQVLERGFHVSFCGNITWSKRVAKLVSLIPDDRLILETDSPLMVPRDRKGIPIKGSERNEPANVGALAQVIAASRGQNVEQVAELTTANAKALFHL